MIDPDKFDWAGDNTSKGQKESAWSLILWLAALVVGLFVVAAMSLGVVAG